MSNYTDVVIREMNKEIPEEGWYLKLYWGYDGGDDEREVKYDPIPSDRKDILLDVLNLLKDMVAKYSESNDYVYHYEDVKNFKKYFDYNFEGVEQETEDYRIIYDLGLCTESDACEDPMKLVDFSVIWHDGKVLNEYIVDIV